MTPSQVRERDEEFAIDAMRNMVAGATGLPAMSITWHGDMAGGFRRLRFTNLSTGVFIPFDFNLFLDMEPLDAMAGALRGIFTDAEMEAARNAPAPPAWTWPERKAP